MGRGYLAVLVRRSPAGPTSIMAKFLLVALALGSSEAARQLRANSPSDSRSLTNTFPFNAHQGEEEHHHGHHGHHEDSLRASSDIASRDQRQRGGDDVAVDFGAVAAARPGQDGKRCIDKVEMVEETEYDDVVQCDHSYDRRCHTTYVTNYESQQEEDCEENFRTAASSSTSRSPSTRPPASAGPLW